MTYKELMINSLSNLLEDRETLYFPIYGTLLQKNAYWFGYFGLTKEYLLITLLLGNSKVISWTSRVPLEIKKVTVKRSLFPILYNISIRFSEGDSVRFRILKIVYGIENQEKNLKGFINFIQKR